MAFYGEPIPLDEEYRYMLIDAIQEASYLFSEYLKEHNLPTNNGHDGVKWNFINKQVISKFNSDRFAINVTSRGIWEFILIFDKVTGFLFTLMRDKNFINLQKNADKNLYHYLNALSRYNKDLYKEYIPVYEQGDLFDEIEFEESYYDDLDKISEKLTRKIELCIKRYALITFTEENGQATKLRCIIPTVGMNYFALENWSEYIGAQYTFKGMQSGDINSTDSVIADDTEPVLRRKSKAKVVAE